MADTELVNVKKVVMGHIFWTRCTLMVGCVSVILLRQ